MIDVKKTVVIFGGTDPEEVAARAVACAAGLVVATAVTAEGNKVHGGTAYQAVAFVVDEGSLEGVAQAIIFECAPAAAGALPVVATCDHHNPGDAGYGLGADQFWSASSLGQLCSLLGVEPTQEQLFIAAGDHCPAAAYAGQCPGVDVGAFAGFRVKQKVAFYTTNPRTADKASAEKIAEAIASAKAALSAAPLVGSVRDLRAAGMIDELPEAALSSGEAYMASIPDVDRERKPTGNIKIVLGGHTTPEAVESFMAWGNGLSNKVGQAYGNPTRGFAGVVVKPE